MSKLFISSHIFSQSTLSNFYTSEIILTPPIGSFLSIFSIFIKLLEFASQKYIRLSIFISYFFSWIFTPVKIFYTSLICLVILTFTFFVFVLILYISQKAYSYLALLTLQDSLSPSVFFSSFTFSRNLRFLIGFGFTFFPVVISLNWASTILFVGSIYTKWECIVFHTYSLTPGLVISISICSSLSNIFLSFYIQDASFFLVFKIWEFHRF